MNGQTAKERENAFHKEWETMTSEEKRNELINAKATLNQFLTMILWENKKADITAEINGCTIKNCPRKFHWNCVEQALGTAIEAISEILLADPL